jgi:hypothetical protein
VVKFNSNPKPVQTLLPNTTLIFNEQDLTAMYATLQRTGLLQFVDNNAENDADG